MRILLDENLPIRLKQLLPGHETASINDAAVGWKGISNGKLLSRMEGLYDLLITADKNIYAQQNLSDRSISILVLPTNRMKDVIVLSDKIQEAVSGIKSREYVLLDRNGVPKKTAYHQETR